MEKDPIFAEAERLYMLENPGGCLAAEDETVKRYWMGKADECSTHRSEQTPSTSKKAVRACPNSELKAPVKIFEDTYRAESIVLSVFFKDSSHEL